MKSLSTGSLLRVLFGLVAVAGLVYAFVRTLDDAGAIPLPSAATGLLALALLVTGQVTALLAWRNLVGRPPVRTLAGGFFLAQLGKYVPGSVWQAVGQVGHARTAGVTLGRGAVAFVAFAALQVVAGALVAPLALVSSPPAWVRAAAGLGLLTTVLIRRRWLVIAVRTVDRIRRREAPRDVDAVVPTQLELVRAVGWLLVTVIVIGVAFGALTEGLGGRDLPMAVGGFALAWTLGFLVLPVPAGLGVREAVLVATLGGQVETAALLTGSILLRVGQMIAEALLVAASAAAARRR